MKKMLVSLFLSGSLIARGADYSSLLAAVHRYQEGYADQVALNAIYEAARSDGEEDVVTRCMGIYSLHLGLKGSAGASQGGVQAILTRYPNSAVARQFRRLDLFASPCETCQGTGSISLQKKTLCETCKNTSKCAKCGGFGKMKYCPYHRCGKVYTHAALMALGVPFWDREICPNCQGKGISSALVVKKCTDCSETGTCPLCRGSAGGRTSYQKCPTCNGLPKGTVNAGVAQAELARLCRDTKDVLQRALDCKKACAEALQMGTPQERLNALNACLAKYDGALDVDKVVEDRDRVAKEWSEREAQRLEEERLRLSREQELAALKLQMGDQHRELLDAIRCTKSKRAALAEMSKFLEANPESAVIVEARLLNAEIEEAVHAEASAEKLNRRIAVGCGGFIGLAALAWLASCVNFTRRVEIVTVTEKETTPRKIPFKGSASRTPALAQSRVLVRRRGDTPDGEVARCPECNALLECTADVANVDVVCAVCRREFHVD